MVKGIGVDILEIERVQHSIDQLGSNFLERIFTAEEIRYCQSKHNAGQHFAAQVCRKGSCQ